MTTRRATDARTGPALQWILPGLLGPLPCLPAPLPALPMLERLFARARQLPVTHPDAPGALCAALGIAGTEDHGLPIAPWSLLGEEVGRPDAAQGYWLLAEPVHLWADLEHLRVSGPAVVAPQPEEAAALVSAFNEHFASDGLQLHAPMPQRWYLRSERPLDVHTRALAEVVMGPLQQVVDSGADAPWLNALLTEAQMLFFTHPVNQRRQRSGRPLLNGLWLWGGGQLPARPEPRAAIRLVGDTPLVRGLARWGAHEHQSLADWRKSAREDAARHTIVYDDALHEALLAQDLPGWLASLECLDILLEEVGAFPRRHGWRTVTLDAGAGGRWACRAGVPWRWWRRQGFWPRVQVVTGR